MIKRKALEAHLWPRWNFSLNLKHRPHSRREANSSGESRLTGKEEGGLRGVSNNGGGVEEMEEGQEEMVDEGEGRVLEQNER